MNTSELRRRFELAVDLAWHAGHISLRYFQTDLEVSEKGDGTPVTAADRDTEALLRETLEQRFPEDGILGEEFGETASKNGLTWVLDPIDGTKSFIHGVPFYGLLMALLEDDEPLLGVMHFPALAETVAAYRGGGCHWNGRRCHVSAVADLSRALATASDIPDPHSASVLQERPRVEATHRLLQAAGLRRTWGDCYGYALVATGRAEVMIDPVVNLWDIAPVLPIIEEAGGRFTSFGGRRTLSDGHSVASNGHLHDAVLAHLVPPSDGS